jgi:hypothetical protein
VIADWHVTRLGGHGSITIAGFNGGPYSDGGRLCPDTMFRRLRKRIMEETHLDAANPSGAAVEAAVEDGRFAQPSPCTMGQQLN